MSLVSRLELLDRAEVSLAKATDLCLKPSPSRIDECRAQLESVAESLAAIGEPIDLTSEESKVWLGRLKYVQARAAELRALHRQAIWLLQGAEQQVGRPILGYSPTGVELAR